MNWACSLAKKCKHPCYLDIGIYIRIYFRDRKGNKERRKAAMKAWYPKCTKTCGTQCVIFWMSRIRPDTAYSFGLLLFLIFYFYFIFKRAQKIVAVGAVKLIAKPTLSKATTRTTYRCVDACMYFLSFRNRRALGDLFLAICSRRDVYKRSSRS